MDMLATEHPPDDAIRAYADGASLATSDEETVAVHIERNCPICVPRLSRFLADAPPLRLSNLLPDPPAPPAPPVIPGLRLLHLLGKGGMGEVWYAKRDDSVRAVAVKVINPSLADNPGVIARFRRESEHTSQLCHPNLVKVEGPGAGGGPLHLVMEYLDGRDLALVLEEDGPRPVGEACRLACQAAAGLAYLHANGLVHRDIKPSNIMVLADGAVKILDLGLIRKVGAAGIDPLTRPLAILGSSGYMAPEQFLAPSSVDARADVYSLGCTIYHLLAGAVAVRRGTSADKPWEAQRLSDIRRDVPPALAEVVATMMAFDPVRRYQTAVDAADALAPFFHLDTPVPVDATLSAASTPTATAAPQASGNDSVIVGRPSSENHAFPAARTRRRWVWAATAAAALVATVAAQVMIRVKREGDPESTAISVPPHSVVVIDKDGGVDVTLPKAIKSVAPAPSDVPIRIPPAAGQTPPIPPVTAVAPPPALDDVLPAGSVWRGTRTYTKGPWANKGKDTVTYDLHVRERAGATFRGYVFDTEKDGVRNRNKAEVEGKVVDNQITWKESWSKLTDAHYEVAGTIEGGEIRVKIKGLTRRKGLPGNYGEIEAVGKLTRWIPDT